MGWYEGPFTGEIFLVNDIAMSDMAADFQIADRLPGIWRPSSADVNGEYNLLAVFDDTKFLYAERDLSPGVQDPPENGTEIGTYTRDAFNQTFAPNLTYDDNGSYNLDGTVNVGSGIGDLGPNGDIPGGFNVNSWEDNLEFGPFTWGNLGPMDRVNISQGGVVGAWFTENTNTGFYAYMILMPDNTFVFMPFVPAKVGTVNEVENGVDVGTYTHANGDLNFTGTWDDSPNAGVGDIGVTNSAAVTLATDANGIETLTLDPANQNIIFNRLL